MSVERWWSIMPSSNKPINTSTITVNLRDMDDKLRSQLEAMSSLVSTRMESFAKQNAPWTDRTSNARNGLHALVETSEDEYKIIIAHGVDYGLWLEIRASGRNSIIPQTVEHGVSQLGTLLPRLLKDA